MPGPGVPDGYHTVTPYLIVGDPRASLEFAQRAFDASATITHEAADGHVMHAEIRIGDSVVMVGGARGSCLAQRATLYLYVPDVDAAYARAIAAGGEPLQAPADHFYGDRTAGVRDRNGIEWYLATRLGSA